MLLSATSRYDEGLVVRVPHSAQNAAPGEGCAPQLEQCLSGAAASGDPQCWQNLPPPESLLHPGQRPSSLVQLLHMLRSMLQQWFLHTH